MIEEARAADASPDGKGARLEEGPPLERITRRLMEADDAWLDGAANAKALAGDAFEAMAGGYPEAERLDAVEDAIGRDRNRRRIAALSLLIASDPWFKGRKDLADRLLALPGSRRLKALSAAVDAEEFRSDGERREELARLCLALLGLRPEGENEAAAIDRLAAVDSVERARLVELSRKAQERARELREAMERAAAEEAASKMSRE